MTKPAQNQGTTLDCGVFAIANTHYIASGKDPSQLNVNQAMLRSHLHKCLQEETVDDFPVTKNLTVNVRQRNTTYNLHCLCRQPADSTVGKKTINCGVCSKIYHVDCLRKWAENLTGKVFLCSKSCLDVSRKKNESFSSVTSKRVYGDAEAIEHSIPLHSISEAFVVCYFFFIKGDTLIERRVHSVHGAFFALLNVFCAKLY